MAGRLTAEEVVTIQVLSKKEVATRAIARQLCVTEGAVRYHLRRKAKRPARSAADSGNAHRAASWNGPTAG